MSPSVIQAAGGVLWRPVGRGAQIAVVHRPQYDDWSLPKGKLEPGEPTVLGAVREVLEETGFHGLVGRRVGVQRYDKALPAGPMPKVVRFWAMRAGGGSFAPSDEVDELRWLSPLAAARLVTLERDRLVIGAFRNRPHDTWPLVVVRHGSAGSRDKWKGDDARRPLDRDGIEQAARLVDVLACYGVRRVVSADVDRCVQTVGPYAERSGLSVETNSLLSEPGYQSDPVGAMEVCLDLLKPEQATALCTQRRVVLPLTTDLLSAYGVSSGGVTLAKGASAVVHVARNAVVDVEQHPPLDDPPDGGST